MTKLLALLMLMLLSACAGTGPSKSETTVRQRAQIHSELAGGYFAQGQIAIALEEFTLSAKIDPDYAVAYNGLGLVHGALGEDAKAEANFKHSLKLDPNSSEAHNNFGTFLCARNRIDESIAEFMKALKNPLYTTPETAYLNAGVCALKKQDEKSAEIYLQKALQIRPDLRQASGHLARIYFDRNEYMKAKNHLQFAMMAQNPGPELAWLGVLISRELQDRNGEASYSLLLKNKYPDSEETRNLLSGK
jgi:type IV pilus assembly protein PilF